MFSKRIILVSPSMNCTIFLQKSLGLLWPEFCLYFVVTCTCEICAFLFFCVLDAFLMMPHILTLRLLMRCCGKQGFQIQLVNFMISYQAPEFDILDCKYKFCNFEVDVILFNLKANYSKKTVWHCLFLSYKIIHKPC